MQLQQGIPCAAAADKNNGNIKTMTAPRGSDGILCCITATFSIPDLPTLMINCDHRRLLVATVMKASIAAQQRALWMLPPCRPVTRRAITWRWQCAFYARPTSTYLVLLLEWCRI